MTDVELRVKRLEMVVEKLANSVLRWTQGGGADAVTSVFTRTGAITAATDDYTKEQIDGLATTDSPQFTGIELGHATDTTLTRASAGNVSIEGNAIYRVGGTDVALADGGTGQSLVDPAADRIMFWDDSESKIDWLTVGTGLSISTTTLSNTVTSPVVIKVKTADETVNNSTTLQDDDELVLALAASTEYAIIGWLFGNSSATADFKYDFTEPTSGVMDYSNSTASASAASNISAVPSGIGANTNGDFGFFVVGHITTVDAGNLTLQWAQNGLEASNTVLKKGAWLMAIKTG